MAILEKRQGIRYQKPRGSENNLPSFHFPCCSVQTWDQWNTFSQSFCFTNSQWFGMITSDIKIIVPIGSSSFQVHLLSFLRLTSTALPNTRTNKHASINCILRTSKTTVASHKSLLSQLAGKDRLPRHPTLSLFSFNILS